MSGNWRDYLKPEEVQQLAELKAAQAEVVQERRKIYARCRKRMERARQANV